MTNVYFLIYGANHDGVFINLASGAKANQNNFAKHITLNPFIFIHHACDDLETGNKNHSSQT